MIRTEVKEDCDRLTKEEIVERVRTVCRENSLPETGWSMWFYNTPGPKCLRRIINGIRTHTAYIQPFWIDVYEENGIRPIACGGLA